MLDAVCAALATSLASVDISAHLARLVALVDASVACARDDNADADVVEHDEHVDVELNDNNDATLCVAIVAWIVSVHYYLTFIYLKIAHHSFIHLFIG